MPVLPLKPKVIKEIARKVKARGYRSTANYMCSMRRRHLEAEPPWSAALALSFSETSRFVEEAGAGKVFKGVCTG